MNVAKTLELFNIVYFDPIRDFPAFNYSGCLMNGCWRTKFNKFILWNNKKITINFWNNNQQSTRICIFTYHPVEGAQHQKNKNWWIWHKSAFLINPQDPKYQQKSKAISSQSQITLFTLPWDTLYVRSYARQIEPHIWHEMSFWLYCRLPRLSCKNDMALRKCWVLSYQFDTSYGT